MPPPIIWEDKIFVQTAIKGQMPKPQTENAEEEAPPEDTRRRRRRGRRGGDPLPTYKFDLLAYNRSNGDILWQKNAP